MTAFIQRHLEAATRFEQQNATGRIYFDAIVTDTDLAEREYPTLSILGTLSVFSSDYPVEIGGVFTSNNLYGILGRPQAGFLQPPGDSCSG